MAQILRSDILKFNPSTLEDVRKVYNLDKPGAMEQAINILDDWIQKQDHFVKKDFRREYLERVIISTKGSIEKAKIRVDKICTMRTMTPNLFEKCDVMNDFPKLHQYYINLHMPQLTDENNRIYIAKVTAKKIIAEKYLEAYQHSVILSEYMRMYDYSHGCHVIFDVQDINIMDLIGQMNLIDFRNTVTLYLLSEYMRMYDYSHGCHVIFDVQDINIMDLIGQMNLIDFRNTVTLYLDGYGFGIKGIYIISSSKMIDAFLSIVKQIVSPKISQRIKVLKNVQGLYKYLPKNLLPAEYGGSQKSLLAIYEDWTKVLSSDKHVAYTREMNQACTNEKLRRKDKFNDNYLGMPGSFKILSID